MNSFENTIRVPNIFPEEGLADPHALVDNGRVYLFCGHDKSWYANNNWVMDKWVIISSDNLVDWKKEGEILPTETYIGDQPNCWAGFIVKKNGLYYWYFSNLYLNIGVMVSDSPNGPFRDALGKPLLDRGIVGNINVYDPCVYEENGVYTIIFGAGEYYAVQLGDDMISTVGEPQLLKVVDKNGNKKMTDDKNTLFKYNGKYYLAWGDEYAISDELYGTYVYQGRFVAGGHNSFFEWNGQPYIAHEHGDISLMYRGVAIKPLFFNPDGTVDSKKSNGPVQHGRQWDFKRSSMGWKALKDTTIDHCKEGIYGSLCGDGIIQSAVWLGTSLKDSHILTIELKNKTTAIAAEVFVAPAHYDKPGWWRHPQVKLDTTPSIKLELLPNCDEFQLLTLDLAEHMDINCGIKCLCIRPAVGATEGEWFIRYISIK